MNFNFKLRYNCLGHKGYFLMKSNLGAGTVISSKKDMRREKLIRVEGESDGKAQEIIVHHGAIPKKRAITAWSWHEEFVAEWSETLITRKKKNMVKAVKAFYRR